MAPAVIVVSRASAFEIELGILGDQPSIIRWLLIFLHVEEHLGT